MEVLQLGAFKTPTKSNINKHSKGQMVAAKKPE